MGVESETHGCVRGVSHRRWLEEELDRPREQERVGEGAVVSFDISIVPMLDSQCTPFIRSINKPSSSVHRKPVIQSFILTFAMQIHKFNNTQNRRLHLRSPKSYYLTHYQII